MEGLDKPTNSLDANMPTRGTPEINGDKKQGISPDEAKCCSLST